VAARSVSLVVAVIKMVARIHNISGTRVSSKQVLRDRKNR
jgi:hypothetical protein